MLIKQVNPIHLKIMVILLRKGYSQKKSRVGDLPFSHERQSNGMMCGFFTFGVTNLVTCNLLILTCKFKETSGFGVNFFLWSGKFKEHQTESTDRIHWPSPSIPTPSFILYLEGGLVCIWVLEPHVCTQNLSIFPLFQSHLATATQD